MNSNTQFDFMDFEEINHNDLPNLEDVVNFEVDPYPYEELKYADNCQENEQTFTPKNFSDFDLDFPVKRIKVDMTDDLYKEVFSSLLNYNLNEEENVKNYYNNLMKIPKFWHARYILSHLYTSYLIQIPDQKEVLYSIISNANFKINYKAFLSNKCENEVFHMYQNNHLPNSKFAFFPQVPEKIYLGSVSTYKKIRDFNPHLGNMMNYQYFYDVVPKMKTFLVSPWKNNFKLSIEVMKNESAMIKKEWYSNSAIIEKFKQYYGNNLVYLYYNQGLWYAVVWHY